jgi:formylglycine-generating enzyme required for sulfatase activity
MKKTLLILSLLAIGCYTWANGVEITAPKMINSKRISFAVSWKNAWKSSNHDAIWLFAKAQTLEGNFIHLNLYAVESELETQIPLDKKGAFLYAQVEGEFEVISAAVEVEFEEITDVREIRLYAIEMVYVPTTAYFLGDSACQFSLLDKETGLSKKIESEQVLELKIKDKDGSVFLSESYPKGFEGFYMMKYEISQAQYAAFLNTLSSDQKTQRTARQGPGLAMVRQGVESFRNTIELRADGEYTAQTPHRACNFLSWSDLLAYLDWAALRPASEMEFEKAARGFENSIEKGFPWGSSAFVNANKTLFDGTDFETVEENSEGIAGLTNCGGEWNSFFLQGPLRCGFAKQSGRLDAGASIWGIRELAGNVWEMCVSVSQSFDGSHGDGNPSTPTNWPASGGYRGGAWNSFIKNDLSYPFRDLAISDRFYMELSGNERRNTSGGRGVRKK